MRPHEGNVRLLRKGVEQGMDKAEADAMLGRDIGKPQGKLAAWPTPTVKTNPNVIDPADLVNKKGEPWKVGEKPIDRRTGATRQTVLADAVRTNWPTPVAGDSEKQPTDSLLHRVVGKGPTNPRAQLNPDWVEMLMGFPVGWTDCAPSETQ